MNTNFLNSLTNFLKKRTYEFVGLLLIFLSIALIISFLSYSPNDPSFVYGEDNASINNLLGIYGSTVSDFLLQSFGLVSFLFLVTLMSWGISLIVEKEIKKIILKLFFVPLYLTFGCIFIYLTYNNSFWLIDNGNSGFVGEYVYNYINEYFPIIKNKYSNFALIFFTFIFFIFASDIKISVLAKKFLNLSQIFKKNRGNDLIEIDVEENDKDKIFEKKNEKDQQSFLFEKNKSIEITKNKNNFKIPSIDLLEKNSSKMPQSELNKNRPNSDFMEKILLDFGVDGKIKTINNGPVVSLYEFEPAAGVKVSKIINLSDDLARNTSSTSARVSVIPGKNTVGIEIPNENREGVVLREIISNERFQRKDIKLPIALGKNISGIPIIGDLTSMPHLLIAGTTGSGKSVCINTIIVSLLYKLSPDLCKLILIDPKMLELSAYEGIPHLLNTSNYRCKKSHVRTRLDSKGNE